MHSWLSPRLTRTVEEGLIRLWYPGEHTLCSWIEYILSGDFLRGLGPVQLTNSLARTLTSYNDNTTGLKFLEQAFTCPVCQTSVKGNKSMQLSCGHVICRDCLLEYWSFNIQEGDIDHVCCPDPDCMKQGREARQSELEQVLTPEIIERWQWLREKRLYERDPTVCICPIFSCQMAIPLPIQVEEEGSSWSRLRTCPSCEFSFCFICRRTWFVSMHVCVYIA
jgi:E3 ubiquitin-protein ligase RNF14